MASLALLVLVSLGARALAAPPAVNPQSGSVGLAGTVPGPPPSTSAIITSPANGSQTSVIPITVSGICPANTFVQILSNGIFVGAVACSSTGTFSLQIDLFAGLNRLIAQVSDALGQFGPNSPEVDVTYNAPAVSLPGGIGRQLFLATDQSIVGASPGSTVRREVTIVGGVAPYALSWDWGDGQSTLQSIAQEGSVTATHVYTQAGIYRVLVRAVDSAGNTAILQLVTVINGPASGLSGKSNGQGPGSLTGIIEPAWPFLILAIVTILTFLLGSFWGKRRLRRQFLEAAADNQ